MLSNDSYSTIEKFVPGVIGSIGALLWIKGTLIRKVSMVILGAAASYYGAPYVISQSGLQENLAGFLVGLFGMSVVDWIFTSWDGILNDYLRARLGLPPDPSRKP